jgi:hypothetical protein
VEEEVITIEPKVGTKPLVVVQVEIINSVMEKTNA